MVVSPLEQLVLVDMIDTFYPTTFTLATSKEFDLSELLRQPPPTTTVTIVSARNFRLKAALMSSSVTFSTACVQVSR